MTEGASDPSAVPLVAAHDTAGSTRRLAARMGWSLGDQALNSLTNFALGLIVARSLAPADFGAFSIAFATFLVAQNAARAVATQPLLIRFSGVPLTEWRRGTGLATGAVLVVGIALGIGCLVAARVASGPLSEAMLALAVTLPGLLVRDTWRFAFFAGGRGRTAFLNDLFLALALAAALGVLLLAGRTSVFLATLAWGGAAGIAAVVGGFQAGLWPRPRAAAAWWHEERDIGARYAGEVTADAIASQVSLYAIAAIAGLSAVAALRAADIVLGPLNVLLQGLYLVTIAEGVRILQVSPRRLRDACMLLSVGLAVSTIAWGLAALAVPDALGTRLLGANWGPGRSVLLPATLSLVGLSTLIGAWVGLRALAAAGRSLRARVLSSTIMLACGIGGSIAGGTVGAAWGLFVGMWIGVLVWWWHFAVALREYRTPSVALSATGTPPIGDS